jgi:hypothetical protein
MLARAMGRSRSRRRARNRRPPTPAPAPVPPAAAPAHERPRAPWHPVPLTELAILAGGAAAVVGYMSGAVAPLATGLVICTLAVLELAVREHFTGFRPHSALLALAATVAFETLLYALVGRPFRGPLALAVLVPIFAGLAYALRLRYRAARR